MGPRRLYRAWERHIEPLASIYRRDAEYSVVRRGALCIPVCSASLS